jgi:hypothetical protein
VVDDLIRRWAAIMGEFTFGPDEIGFHGGTVDYGQGTGAAFGTAMSNQWFGGGSISVDIAFAGVSPKSVADIVFYYNPTTRAFISAGISNEYLFGIRSFDTRWNAYTAVGEPNRLVAGQTYHLECRVRGSLVTLLSDGVEVASVNLPVGLPQSQVGVWCRNETDILLRNFSVATEPSRAFVVIKFTSPFNELYEEVVRPICTELGIQPLRADDTYGPGLIIADVGRQIDEAKLVIAEISPINANVYYEVGYAHARGKPTILIADPKVEKLPFDVSPFRTLFYENSIDGERKVEEGLRRHLKAVLDPSRLSITPLQPTGAGVMVARG